MTTPAERPDADSSPKPDRLSLWSFVVALLALVVTTVFSFLSQQDASKTLMIEREAVLVSECSSPTKKHPDYVGTVRSSDQYFLGFAQFPEYNANLGAQIEECIYTNLGRLPLINVVINYSVTFLKTPVEAPVVPIKPASLYTARIKSIAAGASESVWIVNEDPCYAANVSDGQYASMTVPPDQLIGSYKLPGWILTDFRLDLNPQYAILRSKHIVSRTAIPDCS